MLEVQGLCVQGGAHRVQDASFRVPPGSIHVLLGPTGSGKSMLLEALAGLRPIQAGNLRVDGTDAHGWPPEARGIAYVPQDLLLFPHLTVRDNVRYAPILRGDLDAATEQRILAILERLGIAHLEDRWPATLSGGERQRVSLARALATGCRLLLLDEPFASLNESLRREFWVLLKTLRPELTTLLVTHDLEEAFFLGDTISVLVDGVIHQTDSKGRLYRHPRTRAVAEYLGIPNLFQGRIAATFADHLDVHIPSLGRILRVEGHEGCPAIGASVLAGIRAEDIKIIPPDDADPHHNAFPSRIHALFDRVASHTLHLHPEGAAAILEVEIGSRALARLGLAEASRATAAFRPDHVFLIEEPATPAGMGTPPPLR